MFENARIKLTAWYLVIIMTISLLFSFVIYSSITAEFDRFEKMHVKVQDIGQGDNVLFFPPRDHAIRIFKADPAIIEESKKHLLFNLGFINLVILVLSGAAGYFLAGRTLRPIQKMIDEQKRFITDASHEFRTPLTALRTEIEVGLRNKRLTLLESQKLLKSNLEEVLSLQQLSDNLLELAQNGKLVDPNQMEQVALSEVIEKAYKKIEPQAKSKQIGIKNIGKKYLVKGISDRLTEVFVILLDNAVKYSNKNSEVIITAKKDKKKVIVSVADQGIGVSDEDLPHIFDRFYRASKSRTKINVSGYGLGLSIAKKIVESHGGTITAKSDRGGTTFVLTLSA